MLSRCKLTILVVVFMLFGMSGCNNGEVPKKVNLEKRSPEVESFIKPANQEALKFGFDLRLGPKEDVRIYLPFLRYLEKETGKKFSLEFTQKYEDTVKNLGTGVTQFAALGPVSAVLAKKRYNTNCLVMGLNQDGKAEYRGVIFTTTDSPLNVIKDLKGKTFAFGSRFSTQGHVIPRKMQEDAGISIKDLDSFIFTNSHAATAGAVLRGDYEAGGIQDSLAKRLKAEGKIKIIAMSKPYPSSLICVNKDVDPEIAKAVKKALLTFDPKGKHSNLLVDWDKTEMPSGFNDYKNSSLVKILDLTKRYGIVR